MSDENDLGDFEDYGEEDDEETPGLDDMTHAVEVEEGAEGPILSGVGDLPETEEQAERLQNLGEEIVALRGELERTRPLGAENPLGLDPRIGVKDLCYDRAKPGAKVYVVSCLAGSIDEYEEEFEDAPALDEYAGNVVTRFSRADAVFACVYVKDSLTKVDTNTTAYPMPESRLTRYPAEAASMVGGSEVEFLRTTVPGDPNPGKVALLTALLKSLWGQNPQAPISDLSVSQFADTLGEVVGEDMAEAAIQNAGYEEHTQE